MGKLCILLAKCDEMCLNFERNIMAIKDRFHDTSESFLADTVDLFCVLMLFLTDTTSSVSKKLKGVSNPWVLKEIKIDDYKKCFFVIKDSALTKYYQK